MPYLDMLDNPINVGDRIVYPVSQGSSAANMNQAEVTEIIPIIPDDPKDPECRSGRTKTGTKIDQTRRVLVQRQSGRVRREPSKYAPKGYYEIPEYELDPERFYLIRARRVIKGADPFDEDQPSVMIKNVDRIVVVTSLVFG